MQRVVILSFTIHTFSRRNTHERPELPDKEIWKIAAVLTDEVCRNFVCRKEIHLPLTLSVKPAPAGVLLTKESLCDKRHTVFFTCSVIPRNDIVRNGTGNVCMQKHWKWHNARKQNRHEGGSTSSLRSPCLHQRNQKQMADEITRRFEYVKCNFTIKTTSWAGGMHCALKALIPAARHGRWMKFTFASSLLATAEAVSELFSVIQTWYWKTNFSDLPEPIC